MVGGLSCLMPWFKVDDHLHDHRKARVAGVHAMGLWVLAGSWCADHLMDGFVPAAVALRWGAETVELAERLAVAGLWEPWEQDGEVGWRFHDWKVMQPTRAQVEHERETARERMRLRRSPDVQPNTDRSSGAVRLPRPDPTRPNPSSSTVPRRADVDGLCDLLAALVEGNGAKKPEVTGEWRNQARLMLDRDHRDRTEAERVMRWALADPFWMSNVLSMPTFRRQYDQLKLKSRVASNGRDEDWGEAK